MVHSKGSRELRSFCLASSTAYQSEALLENIYFITETLTLKLIVNYMPKNNNVSCRLIAALCWYHLLISPDQSYIFQPVIIGVSGIAAAATGQKKWVSSRRHQRMWKYYNDLTWASMRLKSLAKHFSQTSEVGNRNHPHCRWKKSTGERWIPLADGQ